MLMTPRQCSKSRDLLGISPDTLACYAGVSIEAVIEFESQANEIPRPIIESIQVALEYAGIQFLFSGAEEFDDVQLRNGVPVAPTASHARVEVRRSEEHKK